MDARNSPEVWIVTTRDILRSEDAGFTWSPVLSLPDSVSDTHGFTKVDVLRDGSIFVIARDRIYNSSDNGVSWDSWETTAGLYQLNTAQFTKLNGIEISQASNLYSYGTQYNIFTTEDGWRTRHLEWSFGCSVITAGSIYFLDSLYGWMYGLNSIYRTTNGGINWTNVTPSVPQSPRILSTWPQPVAQGGVMSTEIELTRPGPVNIELFDLLGRRRAVVWDADFTATRRTLQWSTAGLERGVYVLRMVTGSGIANAKVVVE